MNEPILSHGPLTLECRALIDYARWTGVPGRVTDVNTPGVHSATSRHYQLGTGGKGLSIDCAGPVPSRNSDALLAVYRAFLPIAGALHELIYGGPGGGRWLDGKQIAMGSVGPAHENHVHVSVNRGWRWMPPVTEVRPMFDPPLSIVDTLDRPDGPGAWLLQSNGGINAVGGAPWRGVENQPFEKDYWGNRKAALLESLGGIGYVVIATSGERYEYPA